MRTHLRRALAALALCAALLGGLTAPASAAFQDVPANHWAAESIQRCVDQGFFNGLSQTRFGLGQNISRAGFVTVLCRFFGWETTAPASSVYSDVPADAWYAGAVEAAYQHGVLTDQRAVFRPNDPITREELTVMLLRALGYGSLTGLAQDLPTPFTDITTNRGYITMAHDMGLMSGSGATTFSPAGPARREQVAVILDRLSRQLDSSQVRRMAVVSPESELTELEVAAIPAARLYSMTLKPLLDDDAAQTLRDTARSAGAEAFLYLEGSATVLNRNTPDLASLIAEAAAGYDGLILSVSKVAGSQGLDLTRLTRQVKACLNGLPLYLVVESPTRSGAAYTGYHYKDLAALADKLILKVPAIQDIQEDFTTAPVDPLEEMYYALATVSEQVDPERLALMLDTETTCWTEGHPTALTPEELAALLADPATRVYESDRYACAYLTGIDREKRPLSAWFLTREDVAARVHLAVSLGVKDLCLSNRDAATADFLAGLS